MIDIDDYGEDIFYEKIIRCLAAEIHAASVDAGYWDNPRDFSELTGIVTKEVAKAYNSLGEGEDQKIKGKRKVEVDFADAIIMIFDIAEEMKLDVAGALIRKIDFNKNRKNATTLEGG